MAVRKVFVLGVFVVYIETNGNTYVLINSVSGVELSPLYLIHQNAREYLFLYNFVCLRHIAFSSPANLSREFPLRNGRSQVRESNKVPKIPAYYTK